jgi:hypothetical protein
MRQRSKTDELTKSLETDNINPHVPCFSEHHKEEQDLLHLTFPGYILDQISAIKTYRREVCVFFIVKTCTSAKINISHNCKVQDLEIWAIEHHLN